MPHRLVDPQAGDLISSSQERIQNEILRRKLSLTNAITDSHGTTQVYRRTERRYRRFRLLGVLSAGGYAAVEWPGGSLGVVYDRDTCCWGLPGEQGEAVWVSDADGANEWRVNKNPGQGCYYGALQKDTNSSPCVVVIAYSGIALSCVMRKPPATGEKYAKDTGVYVGHFRGSWEIISILECAVPV